LKFGRESFKEKGGIQIKETGVFLCKPGAKYGHRNDVETCKIVGKL